MSKTGLLVQCAYPFNRPEVPPPAATDAMRYGSACHELLAVNLDAGAPPQLGLTQVPAIAKRFGVRPAELRHHGAAAYDRLRAWLDGGNQFGLKLLPLVRGAVLIEKAIAYDTGMGSARIIGGVDENHVYQDVTPAEQPGTVDVAIRLSLYGKCIPPRYRKAVLVLDHKTGMSAVSPRESAQLRSLALAFMRLWAGDRAIVAINHAPREGLPEVFADELTAAELAEHAVLLRKAFSRIGDGSLRTGPECGYCAGNTVCPAYGGSLGVLANDLPGSFAPATRDRLAVAPPRKLTLTTPEGRGMTHMVLQMMDRIHKEYSERLKQAVRTEGCGVRPDGQITDIVKSTRENLSVASIHRHAKTPAEGQRVEKMLRAMGAIETIEREELRAMADR